MNVRRPMGVLHSLSVKKKFNDKIGLKAFLFSCEELEVLEEGQHLYFERTSLKL